MVHHNMPFFNNNFGAFRHELFENTLLIPRGTWHPPKELSVFFQQRVFVHGGLNTIFLVSYNSYLCFDIVLEDTLVGDNFKMGAV